MLIAIFELEEASSTMTGALAKLKNLVDTVYAVMTPKMVDRIYDKRLDNSSLRKLLVTSLARSFRLRSDNQRNNCP